MERQEFQTLVDASRLYGEEIMVNGDFRYGDQSLAATSSSEGFQVYAGVDEGPVEVLDTFNAYFPIRNNLNVMDGEGGYQPEVMDELDAHAYHTYETSDWDAVVVNYDDFGVFWNRNGNDMLLEGDHSVAIFSNSEDHRYGLSSTRPIQKALPELNDGLEEPMISDATEFALMDPGDFSMGER